MIKSDQAIVLLFLERVFFSVVRLTHLVFKLNFKHIFLGQKLFLYFILLYILGPNIARVRLRVGLVKIPYSWSRGLSSE